jgi:hypothetical protein
MDPGASVTVTSIVERAGFGQIINTANVSSSAHDRDGINNTATVTIQ